MLCLARAHLLHSQAARSRTCRDCAPRDARRSLAPPASRHRRSRECASRSALRYLAGTTTGAGLAGSDAGGATRTAGATIGSVGSGHRLPAVHTGDDRHDQQCHDIDDLDQRIDRRARSVLVRIAHRVAGHCGLVRVRAFAAMMAFFDVLLGVVPRAAAGRHRNRDEKSGDDRAHQHAAERRGTEQKSDDDRHQHRQQRRNHHLLDGGCRQHVDRAAVIRLPGAFHDAFDVAKLAAHFLDHRAGRTADGFHRHRGEQEGNQAADEQTDDDVRVRQVERDV